MADKVYKDFFEFWREKYKYQSEETKQIALDAWDAAVQGTWKLADQDAKALEARIERLEAALKAVEWVKVTFAGENVSYCPACANTRDEDHTSDCPSKLALEEPKL